MGKSASPSGGRRVYSMLSFNFAEQLPAFQVLEVISQSGHAQ